MKREKRKIKVADPEEVARYADTPADQSGDQADDPSSQGQTEQSEALEAVEDPSAASQTDQEPQDECERLQKQVQELSEKHLRAVAELQNFRRRAETERVESIRYASADLIRSLLSVVDDLERSLQSIPQEEADSSLAQGVRLVHQNLLKSLAAHHVERIEAAGETFDPHLHEAMMQQDSPDHAPGTVVEQYQPGYKLWDRVLRPAKVIVAKGAEPAADETADDDAEK